MGIPGETVHTEKVKPEIARYRDALETAKDRISMLETGLEMKTTTIRKIVKEDQDSIEIGAQATGRIKVYGTLGRKTEFAEKIKDAIELLTATREKMKKLDGAE